MFFICGIIVNDKNFIIRIIQSQQRFQRRLSELARELDVPLLRYPPTGRQWYAQHHPNDLFVDLMHLNRRGSALLAERMVVDLAALLQSGKLREPSLLGAAGRVLVPAEIEK